MKRYEVNSSPTAIDRNRDHSDLPCPHDHNSYDPYQSHTHPQDAELELFLVSSNRYAEEWS